MLRRVAERDAVQPLLGLLAHRAAQLAERDVARRIAPEEVHSPGFIWRISLTLRPRSRQHDVAVGIVDGEHALGAGDADFQAVYRARPDDGQRPGDAGVIEASVFKNHRSS